MHKLIHPGQNIVVLTGAGMSAESGVPTFRGMDGLWEGHRIEEVASPDAFMRNPEFVHRFYNLRRAALKTVEPNAGHFALALLEKEWKGEFTLVTQNVDDLHERAGTRRLIHMHGELGKVRCERCNHVVAREDDLSTATVCAACGESSAMRPHIVWFGEVPFETETIDTALRGADLFLCVGTSGVVYPAAGFAARAANNGKDCHLIELNIDHTDISGEFHQHIHGAAAEELPKLIAAILQPNQ